MTATRRHESVRRMRDEDPLEEPLVEDDVERCWGYEIPVRHRRGPDREAQP